MVIQLAKLFLILSATLAAAVYAKEDHVEFLHINQTFNGLFKRRDVTPSATAVEKIRTLWIKQKLDNFNPNETRKWLMRVLVNNEFFKPRGPLFVFVGGHETIFPNVLIEGHVYDMARKYNAYLIHTEHRFYGESKPVKDLKSKNLQYLSVRQALADLAHSIQHIKQSIVGMKNAKVILFGCSYDGAMVAWFKKLYPDVAAGGWASCATVLAKFNFLENREIVGESIRLLGGRACYNRIQNGIKELEKLVAQSRFAELKAYLNICDSFDGRHNLDVWNLFHVISTIFSTVVLNYKNNEIQNTCEQILNELEDLEGLTRFIKSSFPSVPCVDYTYEFVLTHLKDTSFESGNARQLLYQVCNEFSWFPTTASNQQPFGTKVPLDYFTTLCKDLFGRQFTPEYIENKVKETNDYFGGLNPGVKNIYFTQGQLDPWRAVGIQEEGKATVIPLISHCSDFGSISENDNHWLRESKITINKLIRKWLNE